MLCLPALENIMMTKNGSAAAVVAGYMRIAPLMMSPVPWSCVLGVYSKNNLILTDSTYIIQ